MKLVDNPRARVVLFYPRLHTQWPLWAPLDMYAIATCLLHAGYEVTLIDERVDPEPREWLARELDGALFVGIGCKLGEQAKHMDSVTRFIKERRPDCPIVLGGWIAGLFPDSMLQSERIDMVAVGPADESLPQLADRLLNGESMEGLTGIWAKENGRVIQNDKGKLPRIEKTHSIPWEVVNIQRHIHPHGWLNYYTSRGCPGGCTFCAIYCLNPHKWTAYGPERVVDEMEALLRLGARALKIMDTDYCADERRVEAIARLILQRGLKLRYEVLGRHFNLRRFSDEQLSLLRASGLCEIEMGLESGSQRLSNMINKALDVTEVEETIRRCIRFGIRLRLNIMVGLPTETNADLTATMKLVSNIRDEHGDKIRMQLFQYMPLPDAPMSMQVFQQVSRGHDGHVPSTYEEILAITVNDDPAHMHWISWMHERRVKRAYFHYGPLALYRYAAQYAGKRPLFKHLFPLLRRLARWRIRTGFYHFPIDKWFYQLFGPELPKADDDGIGPHEELLPPLMGETVSHPEPLQPQHLLEHTVA